MDKELQGDDFYARIMSSATGDAPLEEVDVVDTEEVEPDADPEPYDDSPDTEPDTTSEEEEPEGGAEEDEEVPVVDARIAAAMKRYKIEDPALAKRLADKDDFIDKQAKELGVLRKQTRSLPPGEADADTTTTEKPNSDLPPPIEFIPREELYDPRIHEVHPDTGLYGEDGDEFPVDELGIVYTPESRWGVVSKALLAKHNGNTVMATRELERLQQADSERYNTEFEKKWQTTAAPRIKAFGDQEESRIAQRIGKTQPAEVAQSLAKAYRAVAAERLTKKYGSGPSKKLFDDNLLAAEIKNVFLEVIDQDLLDTHIEQANQEFAKQGKPVGKKPQPRSGSVGAPARGTGGNGSVSSRQNGDGKERKEAYRIGKYVVTEDEAKKYGGATHTYGKDD